MESEMEKAEQKESKAKEKMKSSRKRKFVGVRQRPSGKWVAEIKNTSQKIRIWLGTFDTAEEAAYAYDEAACLLRGSNTRTNFVSSPSSNNTNSALSRRIRNLVNQKRMMINNSHSQPTPSIIPPTNNVAHHSLVSFTGQMPDVFDYSWAFPPPIPDDLGMLAKQVSFPPSGTEAGLTMTNAHEAAMLEFERIKVERQISASLYAINGVHDYLNACHSVDHDEPIPTWEWDPRLLYHTFCLG